MVFVKQGGILDTDSSYSGSDSDSDSMLYGEPRQKPLTPFLKMIQLKQNYTSDIEMEDKIALFIKAAEDGDVEFMERVRADGVDVDCVGTDGWTALMKACLNGKVAVLEYLLQHNANVHFEAALYTAPMACCTKSNAPEPNKLACLDHILRFNVDLNKRDKFKSTALMCAAHAGYLTLVNRLLLVEEINIHARDDEGWNALFYAVSNNHIDVVERLIAFGADYRSEDHSGRTPLNMAEERYYRKLTDRLTCMEKYGRFEDLPEEEEEEEEDYDDDDDDDSSGEGMSQYAKCFSTYLDELPDEDGEGGFESDTRQFLATFGYSCEGNISFPDFLNMTDQDLAKAGVKIEMRRRMILRRGIHRYHLSPWHKTSMPSIRSKTEFEFGDLIVMLGCLAKHLTLIKASLRYLARRIEVRKIEGDQSLHVESLNSLVECFYTNGLVEGRLRRILQYESSFIEGDWEDRIVSKEKCTPSKMSFMFKYGLIILGATTAGYLMFRSRIKTSF